MSHRDIVIGDVHGCAQELDELLKLVEYTDDDRLVFVGDLVDRGPDSSGVIRRVMDLQAISVLGNHSEWYVRCFKHESNKYLTGKPNPLCQNKKFELFKLLEIDQLLWLSKLPLYYLLDAWTVVVHAGLRVAVPLNKQDKQDCLRLRYLDRTTGKRCHVDDHNSNAVFWTEMWTGPYEVIYGHQPPRSDIVVTQKNGIRCWGIDTGCCFGNKLTAWVRTDGNVEIVSVPAKKQYADWHHSMSEG